MEETAKRELKKCPACAELILAEAVKCKHCGERFGAIPFASTPPKPASPVLRGLPPGRDFRTVLGAMAGAAPGLIAFSFVMLGVIQKTRGYSASDFSFAKAALIGCVLAVILGGVAGLILRWLIPAVHRSGKTAPALGAFSAVYAVAAYLVQNVLLESFVEGSGFYIREDGSASGALAVIALVTAVGSVFAGVRFTRREAPPVRTVVTETELRPTPGHFNQPSRPDDAPVASPRGQQPHATANCPHCGGAIFAGATTCMHCWKKVAG